MDMILKELFHGMIRPEESYRPISREHCMTRKKLAAQQAEIVAEVEKLDPKLAQQMEIMLEDVNTVESMQMEELYIQGMRMGARLALALLEQKKA